MLASEHYASVAVAGPLRRRFTYRVPREFGKLTPGQRVLVPFGNRRKVGFYLERGVPPAGIVVKDLLGVIDNETYFPPDLFQLCLWMADYYFANPADCLAAALPSVVKAGHKAKLVWQDVDNSALPEDLRSHVRRGRRLNREIRERIGRSSPGLLSTLLREGAVAEVFDVGREEGRTKLAGYRLQRDRFTPDFARGKRVIEPFDGIKSRSELKLLGWTDHYMRKALQSGLMQAVYADREGPILGFVEARDSVDKLVMTVQQKAVFESVRSSLASGFKAYLLHGITGSGKTLIYCHLAREVVDAGKTVLILTPEISLSGVTLAYFRGFFGDLVTVLHSAMTDRERLESWQGIRRGKYRIVVGPRSAVFAPLENIGLIVVDEEHDGSYKQDDPSPRFHGRDTAIMRGRIAGVPVVLGSATPSLESFHNAVSGRYELLTLSERPGKARLPVVRIVDMRTQRLGGDLPFISLPLKQEVKSKISQDRQVILYLNRRGYSPYIKCADCGDTPGCPHCNVKLTYHKSGRKLSCHYCGHVEYNYSTCAKCGSSDFLFVGTGTQRVEEQIPRLFPDAKVIRFDSDTASGRDNAYRILKDFAGRKYNLLLGTQMVTKGLDLPGVSLVGVLTGDLELDMPDFRAAERTFSRLLQVAGRSGRTDDEGEVLVQTYYPELELIADAARQDYRAFFERELASRQAFLYPPFVRLVNFVFSSLDEKRLESESMRFRDSLSAAAKAAQLRLHLLGPAPCPLSYLKGKHRRHMFVKTRQIRKLVNLLTEWEDREPHFRLPSSIKLTVDVDPDNMM